MAETAPTKPDSNQSPEKLFIVLGILWLLLSGFIFYQLPATRSNFIEIDWATETETDTAGFNVYRAELVGESCVDVPESDYVRINNQLESAKGDATSGADYSYKDGDVERGVDYCYQLEDIELNGTKTRHDPIKGPRLRQIERVLYFALAPVSLGVGLWLIYSAFRGGNRA